METPKIEREYTQILKGASRLERVLILLFTIVLYVAHTRFFIFLLLALFTYPVAIVLYLQGADKMIFVGTSVIHFVIFEATCMLWPERKTEMICQKEALAFIFKNL
jgi:hypothetical protein